MKNMKKGKDYIGVGVGAIVFNDERKVIVSKRGNLARNERGLWEFPGGGVDFGEKLEDAIKREVREENDIEIEILKLLEIVDHIIEEEGQHWVTTTYIAKHISGEAKTMEPGKCDEVRWIELSEINPEDLSLASRSNFLKYIELYGYNAPSF